MSAERTPRTVRLTTALLLVATFAAGSVTGAAIYRFAAPRFEPARPPPPGMLPLDRLDLSADQQEKARAIMERYRPELETVMRESFPKVRAIHERMDKELEGILTDDQRKLARALQKSRPFPPGPPGMRPPPGPPPGMGPRPDMPPPPGMGMPPGLPPEPSGLPSP
jgi:hypothetical protein